MGPGMHSATVGSYSRLGSESNNRTEANAKIEKCVKMIPACLAAFCCMGVVVGFVALLVLIINPPDKTFTMDGIVPSGTNFSSSSNLLLVPNATAHASNLYAISCIAFGVNIILNGGNCSFFSGTSGYLLMPGSNSLQFSLPVDVKSSGEAAAIGFLEGTALGCTGLKPLIADITLAANVFQISNGDPTAHEGSRLSSDCIPHSPYPDASGSMATTVFYWPDLAAAADGGAKLDLAS